MAIEAGGQYIVDDVSDIIKELKRQMEFNGVKLFYKEHDTPNNLMVCCPFHKNGQERKPSMGIYKSNGVAHCFTCGWSGTLPELISNVFGKNDMGMFGNRWLVQNFLTLEVNERKDLSLDFDRIKTDIKKDHITESELDKYRYVHPYMYKRKLTDDVIELFDVGYDKDTDCITFPVRDELGRCLFIARRSVKGKYFNYPKNVEKPVYGLFELKCSVDISDWLCHNFDVIICESIINALTCWSYGKYAVALNGTGTKYQYEQLNKIPCREFILALDPDDAGRRGTEKIKKALPNKLIYEYIIPEGKDINDLTKTEFDDLKIVFN